jgi:hypothetical protein
LILGFFFFISSTFSWGASPSQLSYINVPDVDCDGNYTVSWDASPGATYYELRRCEDFVCSNPIIVYSGPETSFDEIGVPPEGYYYSVRACNLDGCFTTGTVSFLCKGDSPLSPVEQDRCRSTGEKVNFTKDKYYHDYKKFPEL